MAEKLTLSEAAAKLNLTPQQLKQKVANGEIPAEGTGDNMTFDAANLPKVTAKDYVLEIDDGEEEEGFTLKLEDEDADTDITQSATPPPIPGQGQPSAQGEGEEQPQGKSDSNVFGDETVDLMDTAGATETIELTDDSIAGGDSLAGASDTLAGGDTLGTDTLMAQDSLAATEGQETFLGADILEGLSGDTTAEITSEVQAPEGAPAGVQYVAIREEKSPVTTFMLVLAVVFMALSIMVFVNGLTSEDRISEQLIFSPVKGWMGL